MLRLDPADRVRVVYLDHVAQLSGGELALLRLLRVLPQVEPHVILAEDGPLADDLRRDDISVEVLPFRSETRRLSKDSIGSRRMPARAILDTLIYSGSIARRLRALNPDVVHTNSLKAGIYGGVAARLARIPLVWHLRDHLEPDYLPRTAILVARAWIRLFANVVVCNSESTRATVPQGSSSLVVFSAAHSDGAGSRSARSPDSSPLVVGIVGRLAPWKGQDIFLRAFARAFPDGEQRAVVVGAALFGEDELAYAARLRELADELGITDRVAFRGHQTDVMAEMRSLDVLVHASTTAEPFGQVILEGMCVGLPIVASRGGGPEELITEGVDGLLYPRGDVEQLSRLLVQLDASPAVRTRLARAAVRKATEFSPSRVADGIMTAYERAMRSRPHR